MPSTQNSFRFVNGPWNVVLMCRTSALPCFPMTSQLFPLRSSVTATPCFLYGEAVKFPEKWNFPSVRGVAALRVDVCHMGVIHKLSEDKVVQQSLDGVFHKSRLSALYDDRVHWFFGCLVPWRVHFQYVNFRIACTQQFLVFMFLAICSVDPQKDRKRRLQRFRSHELRGRPSWVRRWDGDVKLHWVHQILCWARRTFSGTSPFLLQTAFRTTTSSYHQASTLTSLLSRSIRDDVSLELQGLTASEKLIGWCLWLRTRGP